MPGELHGNNGAPFDCIYCTAFTACMESRHLFRSIATHNLLWKHRFREQKVTTISPLVLLVPDWNHNQRLCLAFGNVKGELGVQTVGRAGSSDAATDVETEAISSTAADVETEATSAAAADVETEEISSVAADINVKTAPTASKPSGSVAS